MYCVGDIVIYGTQGICKVDAIGPLPMSFADKKRQYYTLRPYYSPEMVIYAPMDNQAIVMRSPLTREQAEDLKRTCFQNAPAQPFLSISSAKTLSYKTPQRENWDYGKKSALPSESAYAFRNRKGVYENEQQ